MSPSDIVHRGHPPGSGERGLRVELGSERAENNQHPRGAGGGRGVDAPGLHVTCVYDYCLLSNQTLIWALQMTILVLILSIFEDLCIRLIKISAT